MEKAMDMDFQAQKAQNPCNEFDEYIELFTTFIICSKNTIILGLLEHPPFDQNQ